MGIDRTRYPGVPQDFPIEQQLGALPGTQPKLLMVEEDGHYYASGTSPSAVQEALAICLDLQQQLSDYCIRKSLQGHARQALLVHVHKYLLQNGWCIPSQSRWICVQIAKELEWELPPELQVKSNGQSPETGGDQ